MALRSIDFIRVGGIGNEVVATSTNDVSGHKTKIVSRIPRAFAMRFGNTAAQCSEAVWLEYAEVHPWMLKTGTGARTVHCEYQVQGEPNVSSAELVLNPLSHCFINDNEWWASYDYVPGPLNDFCPALHFPNGGPDDWPYLLTDESQWASDTPEDPDCVFMYQRRVAWVSDATRYQNLTGTKATFYVKGASLDLKGGTLHYGLSSDDGFWHDVATLSWNNDTWTKNETTMSGVTWHKSFDPAMTGPNNPDLTLITAEQVKAINYSSEPTGALLMAKWLPETP